MKVFLDFEASSLARDSYPIEVAWVFQDGRSESHLIAPADTWTNWDPQAEAIHGLTRREIEDKGTDLQVVARRMVEALDGHDLFASAPSWDGKWLSALLRAAALPRHCLRLRDTDEALRETACETLRPIIDANRLDVEVHNLIAKAVAIKGSPPRHRALPDAMAEHQRWLSVQAAARARAAE